MALIKCPECGRDVSDKAQTCIHCGFPLLNWKKEAISYSSLAGVALSLGISRFVIENRRISKKREMGDMSENLLNFRNEIGRSRSFINLKTILKAHHTREVHEMVAYFFARNLIECYPYIDWVDVKYVFESVDFSILSNNTLQSISEMINGELYKAELPDWTNNPVLSNHRHITYGYPIYQVLLHGDEKVNKDLLLSLKQNVPGLDHDLARLLKSGIVRIDNLLKFSSCMGISPQKVDALKKKYPTLFESSQKSSTLTQSKTDNVDNERSDEIDENVAKTLYIYKGNIRCKKHNHNIISATATLHNISDQDVVINVEYCKDCCKYLLSYDLFLHYRAKYGVLIGDFKIITNDFFDGETELAEESPLHLSGYNVGQKDGYTSNQRHYILAKIIHDGIMTKQAVLNYLSYFVRMNGARSNMELAAAKWREDISFVQNYNISIQPSTIITKITRY